MARSDTSQGTESESHESRQLVRTIRTAVGPLHLPPRALPVDHEDARVIRAALLAAEGDLPRKIRELVDDLIGAGFFVVSGGGKGSHRKFTHRSYPGAVTLSGQDGDDAKHYQERQIKRAIEEVNK